MFDQFDKFDQGGVATNFDKFDTRGVAPAAASRSECGERGISLIRNTPLLGPYSMTISRVIWWS